MKNEVLTDKEKKTVILGFLNRILILSKNDYFEYYTLKNLIGAYQKYLDNIIDETILQIYYRLYTQCGNNDYYGDMTPMRKAAVWALAWLNMPCIDSSVDRTHYFLCVAELGKEGSGIKGYYEDNDMKIIKEKNIKFPPLGFELYA